MKTLIGDSLDVGTITFAPGAAGAGVITFGAVPRFRPERVMAVTNLTRNKIIYIAESPPAGADPGRGGAWSSLTHFGGTLTLATDTTGHNSADVLRCIYEHEEIPEARFDKSLIETEGWRSSQTFTYSGAYAATRTNISGIGGTTPILAFYASHIALQTSRPARIQFNGDRSGDTGSGSLNWDIRHRITGTMLYPVETIFLPPVSGGVYTEGGDGAPIEISGSTAGWAISADVNFTARRTILWIGDSICRGSSQPATFLYEEQVHTFMVRNYLRDVLGKDYRLVTRAQGGSGSSDADKWRRRSALDTMNPKRVNLIFYQMGVNDYGDPASNLTYVTQFVDWALVRFPYATIVLLGPTPCELNAQESGCVTIRSNMGALVSSYSNPRVNFCDLGSAFDRTDAANYTTLDTPGARVHPSLTAGYPAIGSVITDWIDVNLGVIP